MIRVCHSHFDFVNKRRTDHPSLRSYRDKNMYCYGNMPSGI